MDLDLRVVRYAIGLADQLHFGRAASQLTISEQTLSAQILQLETKLGVRLFIRDRRHVEVTAAGHVFVARGRALVADAEAMLAEVARNPASLRVDIIMEGLATTALIALGPLAAQPGVPVETREGQGLGASVPRLLSGEIDLAFGRVGGRRQRIPEALAHMPVRLQPAAVMLPADHPLACRAVIPMRDLREVPLLVQSAVEAPCWQDWQEEFVAAFGLQVSHRLGGHGRSSVAQGVLNSGCGALSRVGHPPVDTVVLRPVVEPVPLFPWSMVWRRANHRGPHVSRACALVEAFVSDQHWLEPPRLSWWIPDADRRFAPATAA